MIYSVHVHVVYGSYQYSATYTCTYDIHCLLPFAHVHVHVIELLACTRFGRIPGKFPSWVKFRTTLPLSYMCMYIVAVIFWTGYISEVAVHEYNLHLSMQSKIRVAFVARVLVHRHYCIIHVHVHVHVYVCASCTCIMYIHVYASCTCTCIHSVFFRRLYATELFTLYNAVCAAILASFPRIRNAIINDLQLMLTLLSIKVWEFWKGRIPRLYGSGIC